MGYQGKHVKLTFRKKTVFWISVVLFLALGTGSVLAYMTVETNNSIIYTTTGAVVDCQLDISGFHNESADATVGGVSDCVTVQNTGNTSAYVRVAIVPSYENSSGQMTWTHPVEETEASRLDGDDRTVDYVLTINETHWEEKDDGFYYYRHVLQPGDTTEPLVSYFDQHDSANFPSGFTPVWDFLADAIQAIPIDGVTAGKAPAEEAWGVSIDRTSKQITTA